MKARQFILGLTLSAVMGGGMAIGGYKLLEENNPNQQEQSANTNVRYSSLMRSSDVKVPEGLNFVAAAQTVTPAVVHVMTEYNPQVARGGSRQQEMLDPFLRDFFGEDFERYHQRQGPQSGSGSGVIIASNGYIVTNNHVIDKADKITVVMEDKREYTATLVGTDPSTDIALLKINANNLPALRYGNSDNIQVGEWVLAVGNPLSLSTTVTAGIVSAKSRSINIIQASDAKLGGNTGIEAFIQTDAAVNPGNSGGALVNLNGDLIGINTAIASPTGSYAGYSFAVPSSIVSKVVDDLLKYGEVQRALLGVQMSDVTAKLAEEKNLETLNGVYIGEVVDNSAAAEVGLKSGDVITQIDGAKINTAAQLQEQVARHRPGDKIKITFLRGDDTKTVTATLRNRAGTTNIVKREVAKSISYGNATFSTPTVQELNKLNLDGGAKISDVKNSDFKATGMVDGFIITRIDDKKVEKPEDVAKYLKSAGAEGVLIEGIYPDGRRAFFPIGRR